MSQLWVKDIHKEIRAELDKRKKYLGYSFSDDREYQEWNARTPWAVIYSNVMEHTLGKDSGTDSVKVDGVLQYKRDKIIDYNDNLAGECILQGVLSKKDGNRSSFDAIYKNDNTDLHKLRPVPTLGGLTIENIDNCGAVRKSVIKFTCYTMQQLEYMEKLYMSPGASIVAQWGWYVIDSLTQDVSFEDRDELKDYENIKKKMRESGGNYGAFIGKVVKFNWNLQEDGSFDCTIEATSRGYVEMFENVKENSVVISKEYGDQTLLEVLNDIKEDIYEKKIVKGAHYVAGELQSKLNKYETGEVISYKKEKYLSIKFIFGLLNLFSKATKGSEYKPVYLNKYVKEDIDGNPIKYEALIGNREEEPKLRSLDRSVFILPRKDLKDIGFFPEESRWEGDNPYSGYVNNILVSLTTVIKSFESATTYKDGIDNIMSNLNEFSNGFWNLELETSPEGWLMINDKNFSPNVTPNNINNDEDILNGRLGPVYLFPTCGEHSMVLNINLSSELPDAMKNAAAYSGVGSPNSKMQGNFGNLYGLIRDKCYDSFGGTTTYPNKKNYKVKEKSKVVIKAEKNIGGKSYMTQFDIPSEYWTYLASCWGVSSDEHAGYSSPALLPLNLSITIDGIEGLQFGNLITIDYLPDRYKNNSAFAIKGISHDIGLDGWTTTIETQFRVRATKKVEQQKEYTLPERELSDIHVIGLDNYTIDERSGPSL